MLKNFNDDEQLLGSPNDQDNSIAQASIDVDPNFENQIEQVQNRYKAKTSNDAKSALHFSIKNPNRQHGTKSEAFRGDHDIVMAKYTIFWSNKREDNKLYRLVVELPYLETVIEAIRDIIPYMNQLLAKENSNYTLLTDASLYEFYKARKSGLPKVDYPALDANQVLSQTGIQNICLVETSLRAIIQKNIGLLTPMVTPEMPNTINKSFAPAFQEEQREEKVCFCFTKKRDKKENKDGLKASLMDGF